MKLTQGTGMGTCWWINIIMFFNKTSILRKENVFIKSRYSRNRQWCRPIVVLTLLLNFLTVLKYGNKLSIIFKCKNSCKDFQEEISINIIRSSKIEEIDNI